MKAWLLPAAGIHGPHPAPHPEWAVSEPVRVPCLRSTAGRLPFPAMVAQGLRLLLTGFPRGDLVSVATGLQRRDESVWVKCLKGESA